jgi:F0F1-type ATP synthase assembly protein I
MKKLALLALLAVILPTASAATSQQEAGTACNPYALESESISVTGPLSCEGSYWICKFNYYGNEQNAMLAVDMSGHVLPKGSDILKDLIATSYAADRGSSSVFGTFLSDSSFAMQLAGMNTTMQNYMSVVRALREDGTISQSQFEGFKKRIDGVRKAALELSSRVLGLGNLSDSFIESPDCVKLISYLDELNGTVGLALNFTESWADFIAGYNSLASGLGDARISAINPSDAQIMRQSVEAIGPTVAQYKEDQDAYVGTVLGNLGARYDRKAAKDKLDEAYDAVKGSLNPNATSRYNDAAAAFSNSEYAKSVRLSTEAISLAPIVPQGGDGGTAIKAADYSPFIIAVGLLLGLVVLMTLMRKRDGSSEQHERRSSSGKGWGWVKEDSRKK